MTSNDLPVRAEPFLALTDDGDRLRDAVIAETLRLYKEATDAVGSVGFEVFASFQNPKVGDLVLELTRSGYSRDSSMRRIGFGYLVYAQGSDYQVQYGQGPDDVCDWSNCLFIRVPQQALASGAAGTQVSQ
jgi:hypothetical protein